MLKFTVLSVSSLLVLVSLHCGQCYGFLPKYFSSDNIFNSGHVDHSCEGNRVKPRIALAVVGGTKVSWQKSAPYMAALGAKTKNGSVEWYCGGSVLSATEILTAAHCLVSRDVDTVRVGSLRLTNMLSPYDYRVDTTIIHEQYRAPQTYHDVAVVRLRDKLPLSSSVRPVCLSKGTEDGVGTKAQITGWGSETMEGDGSQELQQVQVEVFSNEKCNQAYENSSILPDNFPEGIKEEQMCAGSRQGGKDACQGDSGGPLVTQDDAGIIRQIGIVSSGEGCGLKKFPGVYIKVSRYTDWIQRQLQHGSAHSAGATAHHHRKPHVSNADGNHITFPY